MVSYLLFFGLIMSFVLRGFEGYFSGDNIPEHEVKNDE